MSVGTRTPHHDWDARTRGAATYTDDLRFEGELIARVVRSPHPHARIRSIDTTRAERAPGVAAVITWRDFGGAVYQHMGGDFSDRRPLARDTVRYVGEEIAAVAAETPAQADHACRQVRTRFRALPFVSDVEGALATAAPTIHPRPAGKNLALDVRRSYGDAAQAQRDTAVRVRGRYRFNRQSHASMEPNSVVAAWDEAQQRLELWVSTQSPYFVRKEVAHVLGLSKDQVVTHEVAVGGGFGSKSKISEHEVLAAALAMKSGRPVRLVLDRAEEFATTKSRHDFLIELETGATSDGRLTYRKADIVVDNGAYNHSGPSVANYGSMVMASLYRTAAVDLRARLVDTNKQPGGQFRGYAGPQVVFAIEAQMDDLATKLDIDPIELRIRNANRTGDTTHTGWRLASANLGECLETARDLSGWLARRGRAGTGRGLGVAVGMHVSGARAYEDAERSDAGVDVDASGRVTVRFGGADSGTWQETILAQICAHELGIDPAAVRVQAMESHDAPLDLGAWSSRATYMSGHAVRQTAQAVADELRQRAADKLGASPASVTLRAGQALANGESIGIGDLAAAAGDPERGGISIEESFLADNERPDPATGVGNLSPAYSFAAHVVEVEVDAATGAVEVVDVVAAHDSGIAINPTAVEGQIIGGVAMGLGAALGEELVVTEGKVANPTYIDYALPRAADLPPIRSVLVEHHDPKGPYGAKGVGEVALVPAPAAAANAVAHALGRRITELPLTPDRVLGAQATTHRHGYALWRRPDRWWVAFVRWAYPRGLHHLLDRLGTKLRRLPAPAPATSLARPTTAAAASAELQGRHAVAIAGGTDLLPATEQGLVRAERLVDLTGVEQMHGVRQEVPSAWVIGAGTTLAEMLRAEVTRTHPVLHETIAAIASPQIREMATVGGNLCQEKRCWYYRNGFPCYKRSGPTAPCYAVLGDHRFYHAAVGAHRCQAVTPSDLATTLTALDATLRIAGSGSERDIAVSDLYTGPGETQLARDEILTEVRIPAGANGRAAAYEKVGRWSGDFALVSVCVSTDARPSAASGGTRVVLGGIAPTPYRATRVETAFDACGGDPEAIPDVARAWTVDAHPLPGNEWKIDAACGLVAKALRRCVG